MRAISSAVERPVYTGKVAGSIPASPTTVVVRGRATAIAEMGERALARANHPADVRRLEARLAKARKIIAEVTENHREINKIGKVWLNAIRKGGGLLREMAAAGERQTGGGDPPSRRARVAPPTLDAMGFTYSRSSRWQMAESVPLDQWVALMQEIIDSDERVLTLEEFLAKAKHLRNERTKVESVIPTTATITRAACLDWLLEQADCDLLLTDPPYSTDVDDIEAFATWLPVALKKVKPSGRAFVCIGAYGKELKAYLNLATPVHLIGPQVLVWTYRNTLGPAPTHVFKQNWQAILYFYGVDAPPLDCPEMVEQFSVLDLNAPDGRHGDHWHAWQKPDALGERFVRLSSKPGDLVLDPFAGSGSFLLAAAKLGRVAHGCDVDSEMVALAKRRGCRRGR